MDTKASVKVCVRIRPLVAREEAEGCQERLDALKEEKQITVRDTSKRFAFDYVLGTNSSQSEVYSSCVVPLLQSALKGYNSTVLAYGQTGSGKTFTMGSEVKDCVEGHPSAGVLPRLASDLFKSLNSKAKSNKAFKYRVQASYLEIYRERINDLLKPSDDKLAIREDSGRVYVAGLHQQPIESVKELVDCLQKGALSRSTGATKMNSRSSRSHAIFTLQLKQWVEGSSDGEEGQGHYSHEKENKPKENNDTNGKVGQDGDENILKAGMSMCSQLFLVDLAGSERAKKTGASGARLKEGIKINAGLLALGNVISILGDTKRRGNVHIPYRDSKLTRLLQHALGGNSQTLMIACVSPADSSFDETINTLRYASRARNIQNTLTQNVDNEAEEVASLKREVQSLRRALSDALSGRGMYGMESSSSSKSGGLLAAASYVSNMDKAAEQKLRQQITKLTIERDQWRHHAEKATGCSSSSSNDGKKEEEVGNDDEGGDFKIGVGVVAEQAAKISTLEQENEKLRHQVELLVTNAGLDIEAEQQGVTSWDFETANDDQPDEASSTSSSPQAPDATTTAAATNECPEKKKLQAEMEELAMLVTKKAEQLRAAQDPAKMEALRVKYHLAVKDLEKLEDKLKTVNAKVKSLTDSISDQRRKLNHAEKQRKLAERLKKELADAKRNKVSLAHKMRSAEERWRIERKNAKRQLSVLQKQKNKQGKQLSKVQAEKNRKENMLLRKNEKLSALQKRMRLMMKKQKNADNMRNESIKRQRRRMLHGRSVEEWLQHETTAYLVHKKERENRLGRLFEKRKEYSLEAKKLSQTDPQRRRLEQRIRNLSRRISELQTSNLNDHSRALGGGGGGAGGGPIADPIHNFLPNDTEEDVKRAFFWMFDQMTSALTDLQARKSKSSKKKKNWTNATSSKNETKAAKSEADRRKRRRGQYHHQQGGEDGDESDSDSASEEEDDEQIWEEESDNDSEIEERERERDPDWRETPVAKVRRRSKTSATSSSVKNSAKSVKPLRAVVDLTASVSSASSRRRRSSVSSASSAVTNSSRSSTSGTTTTNATTQSDDAIPLSPQVLLEALMKAKVKLTVKDLKRELEFRSLPKKGRKSDLVERLLQSVRTELGIYPVRESDEDKQQDASEKKEGSEDVAAPTSSLEKLSSGARKENVNGVVEKTSNSSETAVVAAAQKSTTTPNWHAYNWNTASKTPHIPSFGPASTPLSSQSQQQDHDNSVKNDKAADAAAATTTSATANVTPNDTVLELEWQRINASLSANSLERKAQKKKVETGGGAKKQSKNNAGEEPFRFHHQQQHRKLGKPLRVGARGGKNSGDSGLVNKLGKPKRRALFNISNEFRQNKASS
eukprot:jgi/Bigna1/75626/fgenesh1_pg.36_\